MSWQATKAVMEHSTAKGAARLVLCVLAYHANAKGQCSPSPGIDLICREANLSERGARYALRELEELGEVVTEIGRGKGNLSSFEIRLPIETEGESKGAILAPFEAQEKGQNTPQKGQGLPVIEDQKGQSVPQKGQNTASKGAKCDAHIGRTVFNRHEPSSATTDASAPFSDPPGDVDSTDFAEANAMNDFLAEKYRLQLPASSNGYTLRNFRLRQEAMTATVSELQREGATLELLKAFFAERKVLPGERYIVSNYLEWLPKHIHATTATQNGNGGMHAKPEQRPRETHNGRNARLTLELLGVAPQLTRQGSGVPDSSDEPEARIALVKR